MIYAWIYSSISKITDVVDIQEPNTTDHAQLINTSTFLMHVQCINTIDYIEFILIYNLYQINMINWICMFVCLFVADNWIPPMTLALLSLAKMANLFQYGLYWNLLISLKILCIHMDFV